MATPSDVRDVLLVLADEIESDNLTADEIISRLEGIFEIIGMIAALDDVSVDADIINSLRSIEQRVLADQAQDLLPLRVGRPRLDIPSTTLRSLVLSGVPVIEIADMFAVSPCSIRRRMLDEGLRKSDRYSAIGDEELDAIVQEVQHGHPNAGCKMMMGHLRSRGIYVQRFRVAESLRRVDPNGVLMRQLSLRTTRRRQYNVPGPNCLWHIDGNHKLIRWRIIVHGGIDGFSRLVVYLTASTNNKATTVFDGFMSAVSQYGIPSRVRSDKGGENVKVAHFMVQTMGQNRNSHITGRSVHNQRIERLWRDVYENVLDLFYTMFTQMEVMGLLNPGEEIDLFALHRCFLHHIQNNLQSFKAAWNEHGMRTVNNHSPMQLWLLHRREGQDFLQVDDDYGVDWTGPYNHPSNEIIIPELQLPRALTEQEFTALPNLGVPLSETLTVYLETVNALKVILNSIP